MQKNLILKGVATAMGIAVVVLNILQEIDTSAAITMLGLGLSCLAIVALEKDR